MTDKIPPLFRHHSASTSDWALMAQVNNENYMPFANIRQSTLMIGRA